MRARSEALRWALRVAQDIKAFKRFPDYLNAREQAARAARQNEGWLKHTNNSAKAGGHASDTAKP